MSSRSAKGMAIVLGFIALAIYVAYIVWIGVSF
jgi:hypothetical protein